MHDFPRATKSVESLRLCRNALSKLPETGYCGNFRGPLSRESDNTFSLTTRASASCRCICIEDMRAGQSSSEGVGEIPTELLSTRAVLTAAAETSPRVKRGRLQSRLTAPFFSAKVNSATTRLLSADEPGDVPGNEFRRRDEHLSALGGLSSGTNSLPKGGPHVHTSDVEVGESAHLPQLRGSPPSSPARAASMPAPSALSKLAVAKSPGRKKA